MCFPTTISKAVLLTVTVFLLASGCASTGKTKSVQVNNKPAWVLNVPDKGAVGRSGWTPLLPAKQKEIARARALVLLAMQTTGAEVSVHQELERKVENDRMRAKMLSTSTIDVNGTIVKGRVAAEWKDPNDGSYNVWMLGPD